MASDAKEADIQQVIRRLSILDIDVHRSSGAHLTVLGAIGVHPGFDARILEVLPGVRSVHRVSDPFKFASRTWKPEGTTFRVGPIDIGEGHLTLMAGPSAVEHADQITRVAYQLAQHDVPILWGGAYKQRLSPFSPVGLGSKGLRLLRDAADRYNLLVLTEATTSEHVAEVAEVADLILVGARNMEDFQLLESLSKAGRPVVLKRGPSATIEEWLMSADFLLSRGLQEIILCERGVLTFGGGPRNILDLMAVPALKERTHLPVFVDPSRGAGLRAKVPHMARAAVAAGADGLLLDIHPAPDEALVDGPQAMPFSVFDGLIPQLSEIARIVRAHSF